MAQRGLIDGPEPDDSRGGAAAFSCLPSARRRGLLLAGALALGGCATAPPPEPPGAAAHDWHEVRLPGKRQTRYHWEHKSGRRALAAHAERSASMWRRRIDAGARAEHIELSWWVDRLPDGGDLSVADSADAPARVLLGFDGDRARLSARNRMMFDLAQAVTGEEPPFATLMYVWASRHPVGSVVHNPRTDRVRKIVLDSGSAQLGRWRDHRRDLRADFRRAFGEDPGPLRSVAVMTDADNTASSARAWYGPIRVG